jgi:predicted secreted hydrolase
MRRVLASLLALALAVAVPGRGEAPTGAVVPGRVFSFPADHGAHPDYRTEWWYVTGWLEVEGKPLGFQITFFRSRIAGQDANPSRFAPRQILIAHAALSDPARGRLLHDQRVARAGFGLAEAVTGAAGVTLDGWRFAQAGEGFHAVIPAREFRLDLQFGPTQPPLLQGEGGYSRKGPQPASASYYYTLPHLTVAGSVTRDGRASAVTGEAWLDREWSSQYMDEDAEGWDWTGVNFDDGSALMAFRMRRKGGGTLWAGGTLRRSNGAVTVFRPDEVQFTPRRSWKSPRSGASYPVALSLRAGPLELELEPLMDDQENDTRLSTGTIYWEGAVTALEKGRNVGRGYLELTGYWQRMRL